jgi:hypothetical protein
MTTGIAGARLMDGLLSYVLYHGDVGTNDHKKVRSLLEEIPRESNGVGHVIVDPRRPQVAVDQPPYSCTRTLAKPASDRAGSRKSRKQMQPLCKV